MAIQEGKAAAAFTLPDADGKVPKHWANVVKAADHPAKVLEALQSSP